MILIDGRMVFQNQADGVARVVVEMLRHRPRSTPAVGLVVPRDADLRRFGLDELLGDLRVHPVKAPIVHIWKVREIGKVIEQAGYGVFLAPYAPLMPLQLPCPAVAHVHDCIIESDVRLSKSRAQQLLYIANMIRVLRQSQAAVVPSETTAATLGGVYSALPETVVCRNGVSPERFAASAGTVSAAAVLEKFGIRKPFVLAVGARRPHKNQKVLVDAIDLLPSEVSLVLVGNPDPRVQDDVAVALGERGAGKRIVVLPRADEVDLAVLFREAAVFAFPSVAEGFGLPPLEAMAAGTPVVASSIPVVAEVTLDAATLVSPYLAEEWARAIATVIRSPEKREHMVRRGREVVQDYGWATGSSQLFSVLERVATGAPTSAARTGSSSQW